MMTTANKITIVRILLVPFFFFQLLEYVSTAEEFYRWLAMASFAIAAITDGVDGFIARRYNQRSELGAVLDPLADKLLLMSGIILLSVDHSPHLVQLPLWLVATVISRDLLLLLGLLIIHYFCGKVVVRPRVVGKIATVLQMTTVVWTMAKFDAGWLMVWAAGAALFTGISGLWYVHDGVRQLSASPTSSAAPKQP